MAIQLSQTSVQTNLFVRLDIPGYEVLRFSDHHRIIDIDGESYNGLGQLMSLTDTVDQLRATASEVSLTISGIGSEHVPEIATLAIKGSKCTIFRGFFDAETGVLLPIDGNPAGKFSGVVSNFELLDDLEMGADTSTFTLLLTVTSIIEILRNKINSRRTSPADFPNGLMDRVPALAKTNFNFGAPQ